MDSLLNKCDRVLKKKNCSFFGKCKEKKDKLIRDWEEGLLKKVKQAET